MTEDNASEELLIPFSSELEENMSRVILLEAQTQAELTLASRTQKRSGKWQLK